MNIRRPSHIFYADTVHKELSPLGKFVEGFNHKATVGIEIVGVIGAFHHRPAFLFFTAAGLTLNHYTNKRIRAHKRAEWYREYPYLDAPVEYMERPSLKDCVAVLKTIWLKHKSKPPQPTA